MPPVTKAARLRTVLYLLVLLSVAGMVAVVLAANSLAAPQMRWACRRMGFRTNPRSFRGQTGAGERMVRPRRLRQTRCPAAPQHPVRSAGDGRTRSIFLHDEGYSVLLIDRQAHGKTPGQNITFGHRESRDVHAAVRFLRSKIGGRRVGVIGVSLGGAAALLGESPVMADAVVIEGVYSSIEPAVRNRIRIRFGEIGAFLAPLFTMQIERRLGTPLDALSPVDAIGRLQPPVLVFAGTRDRHTPPMESLKLFERANRPKRLWLIRGAAHQDLHAFAPAQYRERVLEFLRPQLNRPGHDTHVSALSGRSPIGRSAVVDGFPDPARDNPANCGRPPPMVEPAARQTAKGYFPPRKKCPE